MKWYHFSVEYFEDLRNVNHCEFLIMRKQPDSGKYILENNLRTWSQLRQERLAAAQAAKKDSLNTPTSPSSASSATPISEKDREKEKKLESLVGTGTGTGATPIPMRKKWGGCPNGCDHAKHSYRKENSMHAMQLNGKPTNSSSPTNTQLPTFPSNPSTQTQLPLRRPPPARRWQSSSGSENEDDPRGRVGPPSKVGIINVQKSLDEVVSSPDGTPSYISVEDRLRSRIKSPKNELLSAGRDFGGSASGNTSIAGSEHEESEEEHDIRRRGRGNGGVAPSGAEARLRREHREGKVRETSGMGRGALADALGDQSDVGSDAGSEFEELEREEREDKSVRGNVY